MKRAVVTLCIGSGWNQISDLTHPLIKKYANKTSADFLTINNPIINSGDIGFEKFQLQNILNYYDRIIYIDTDIIIKSSCPNLFDIVPEKEFGAFQESDYMLYSPDVDHHEAMTNIQKKLEWINWSYGYFNTGVMVMSKKHKPIFDINHGQIVHLREQTQLNYNFRKLGFYLSPLDIRFNKMDFINPNEWREAYIVHLAGRGYGTTYHDLTQKCETIKAMLEIIKNDEKEEQILNG